MRKSRGLLRDQECSSHTPGQVRLPRPIDTHLSLRIEGTLGAGPEYLAGSTGANRRLECVSFCWRASLRWEPGD
jgi:hypothetical protein